MKEEKNLIRCERCKQNTFREQYHISITEHGSILIVYRGRCGFCRGILEYHSEQDLSNLPTQDKNDIQSILKRIKSKAC